MNYLKLAALACALLCAMIANAQTETITTTETKERKFEHHVGLQMNELVRQVFNFSNSSSTVTNPYLLTYNINFKKSGWGIRVGAGYNKRQFADDDGITKKETNLDNINARLGFEKAFHLSHRWTAGVGVDGIFGLEDNNTKSAIRSVDSSKTEISTQVNTLGGGIMGWLRYDISPHVVIGTEASFYYSAGDQTQDISITQYNTFPVKTQTTTSKISNKKSEMIMTLPVVLYLYVRF